MTAPIATHPDLADRARAREARVLELHRATRAPGSVLQMLAIAGLVALLPLVPGVEALLGLPLGETAGAVLVFVLAMLLATAVFHATGPSRAYWWADAIEIWCSVGVVLALVYATGSALSVFWLFFLIHGFFSATSDPWPHTHEAWPYVVGPLALALAFLVGDGTPADAAISVALGACQVWLVTLLARTTRRVEALMVENAALAADLAAVRVREERGRIARDLHDGLGAALTSMLWQARALEAAADGPTSERAAALRARVAASVEELRNIVSTFRPRARAWPTFVDELAQRCQAVARVPVVVEAMAGSDALVVPGPAASDGLLAALELVRNADRHAEAGQIALRVEGGARLRIVVEDDGNGLPAHALATSEGGLANLLVRAQALGGTLAVHPRAAGTRVEFDVPLASPTAPRTGSSLRS